MESCSAVSVSLDSVKVYHESQQCLSEQHSRPQRQTQTTSTSTCLEVSREIRASPCSGRDDSKSVPNLNVSRGVCLICVYSPSLLYLLLSTPTCIFLLSIPTKPHLPLREREGGREGERERERERVHCISNLTSLAHIQNDSST